VALPVVEADTGLILVDVKIIASVKIVTAVVIAGYLLHSKVIFLLLSLILSVFILYASEIEKTNDKRVKSIDEKRYQCSERISDKRLLMLLVLTFSKLCYLEQNFLLKG
jgi:hypothetical protein